VATSTQNVALSALLFLYQLAFRRRFLEEAAQVRLHGPARGQGVHRGVRFDLRGVEEQLFASKTSPASKHISTICSKKRHYIGADADYNYAERIDPDKNPSGEDAAEAIKGAVKRVSLTGDIMKRLITLHGTLDALFPIKKSADKYAELVEQAGRSEMHRYYQIEGGTHVASLYDYPRNIDLTKSLFGKGEGWDGFVRYPL
jgi:hypothetical protein